MSEKWRESSTYRFVAITWLLISLSYLWQVWNGNAVTITEYTTGVATILGIWLGREWKETHYKNKT